MEDTLTIATAEGVRIYAITTKNLVQEAADRHHTSHLATAALGMKRFVKCFFELLTQIIVKVRKCKVQRVCVLHFQLAGSGGCFFLMKLYH